MIRRATAQDVPTLANLYARFYAEDAIDVSVDRIRKNLGAMVLDERAAIWVVEHDGNIVGFSSASLTLGIEFGWASEIEDLYVLPEHRGKGLAKRLFQTAIDWSETCGASEILLVVTPEAESDQGLIAFYEKLGFSRSDRIVMYKSGNQ
ncbi:GNAT family N-acetyltransferase [Hwanghaeella grinnelliae]|uniref:GNAT family N-acetyltransferase n=1 Tax=Hwanghaeella grinnelliae TaxID=2500179 RepID=A0A3S2VNI4_9PROT|nr:GNAT family N-acetyltransferase [Hwanghaeella grinnelliae]RVU34764.1 GNAT family N-acetyltransferase [Hwanghaeella grinnelliae]